ncbi:MAG: ABC transporter permease subunit [Actinobacteria bacterium]|nr:ABC transporter permease subunit [Actinomycetota bacterium]
MIWLTWRQFRVQAVVTAAILAVFGVLLLVTGPSLGGVYRTSGFAACHSGCAQLAGNFLAQIGVPHYHLVYLFGAVLIIVLPAIIGLFWGAPLLARELEAGTFRLAWNQSVTRERWLAVKLGVLGLASMAAAGLLSLILGWWASPIDRAAGLGSVGGYENRFFPVVFGTRGIAPLGYAAFAFVLGVLIGLLIRRTVPAMAVTLGLIAAVQIAFPLVVRPHLITPVRHSITITASAIQGMGVSGPGPDAQLRTVFAGTVNTPGAWVYSDATVTASGSPDLGTVPAACQNIGPNGSFQPCQQALAARNFQQQLVYQPASRYWTFQALEFGIYLTVAIVLAWASFWLLRRRLS